MSWQKSCANKSLLAKSPSHKNSAEELMLNILQSVNFIGRAPTIAQPPSALSEDEDDVMLLQCTLMAAEPSHTHTLRQSQEYPLTESDTQQATGDALFVAQLGQSPPPRVSMVLFKIISCLPANKKNARPNLLVLRKIL